MIRIVVADDHPVFRAGLYTTLGDEGDMIVVGEATTGDAVVGLCTERRPDVLLLDLRMPGQRPEETVATLRDHLPTLRIVAVTAFDDAVRLRALVRLGVTGYVLKDESPATLVAAIRAVAGGKTWLSAAITSRIASKELVMLTEREREILRLLAVGWKTAAIAAHVHLGEQTVRNYLSVIYEKIGVSGRTAAVHWAREHAIL